jgi:hypothetical protein
MDGAVQWPKLMHPLWSDFPDFTMAPWGSQWGVSCSTIPCPVPTVRRALPRNHTDPSKLLFCEGLTASPSQAGVETDGLSERAILLRATPFLAHLKPGLPLFIKKKCRNSQPGWRQTSVQDICEELPRAGALWPMQKPLPTWASFASHESKCNRWFKHQ